MDSFENDNKEASKIAREKMGKRKGGQEWSRNERYRNGR